MSYNFPLHHYSDFDIEKDASVLKPGSVVLKKGKPFAYSLAPKLVDTRCDTCFKLEEKAGGSSGLILSKCGGCQQVKFCNKDCQRKGWSDGHKYECKGFQIQRRVASSFARLLLRVIVKLQKQKDYYDEVSRRKVRRRFKDLVSHSTELKNDAVRMEQVETMAGVVRSLLSHHPEINFPESELLGICGRIFVNTFSITDYENHTLGTGLYLGASIFDHSCQPMAVADFDSVDIIIRNIREIPVTLPIFKVTICYRDVLRPTDVRRAELKRGYYFDCECEKCSERMFDDAMQAVTCPQHCDYEINLRTSQVPCLKCNFEFNNEYKRKMLEIEEITKLKLLEMGDIAYLDVAEVYLNILSKNHFSDTHWLMIEMGGIAFDGCIDIQRWDTAYKHGLMVLKGYRKYLYHLDPMLGLMLLKMAKLAWYLEKEKDAKSFLSDAAKILNVTHGRDSQFAYQHILPLSREINLCSNFQQNVSPL